MNNFVIILDGWKKKYINEYRSVHSNDDVSPNSINSPTSFVCPKKSRKRI